MLRSLAHKGQERSIGICLPSKQKVQPLYCSLLTPQNRRHEAQHGQCSLGYLHLGTAAQDVLLNVFLQLRNVPKPAAAESEVGLTQLLRQPCQVASTLPGDPARQRVPRVQLGHGLGAGLADHGLLVHHPPAHLGEHLLHQPEARATGPSSGHHLHHPRPDGLVGVQAALRQLCDVGLSRHHQRLEAGLLRHRHSGLQKGRSPVEGRQAHPIICVRETVPVPINKQWVRTNQQLAPPSYTARTLTGAMGEQLTHQCCN
mmetsp:Transcript_4576/g.11000  ORF Transcript_4576/g.11000 Transcript_4576/m.11000 type:complete len:258 (-) Transcript_4576:62-835(-)